MDNTQTLHANVVLDLKGLTCPGPLLGAKNVVDELSAGQVLLLLSDCPGTQADLFAWTKQTGNQIMKIDKLAEGGNGYYIQKGRGNAHKVNVLLDIRNVVCPGPIVEAKKLLNGMNSGEILKLISNCPGISTDIAGWAAATGMQLLDSIEVATGEFEFYIRKG